MLYDSNKNKSWHCVLKMKNLSGSCECLSQRYLFIWFFLDAVMLLPKNCYLPSIVLILIPCATSYLPPCKVSVKFKHCCGICSPSLYGVNFTGIDWISGCNRLIGPITGKHICSISLCKTSEADFPARVQICSHSQMRYTILMRNEDFLGYKT